MNPLTPYMAWIKLGVFVAICAGCYVYGGSNATAKERLKWQTRENKALAEAIEQRDQARRMERDLWKAISEIDAQNERDKRDAKAAADRLAADLRAGNVKLRNRWQGCEATGRVSGAAASAAESDAAARDREESASRVVQAARDADNQIRGLQEVIRAWTPKPQP